MWQIKISELRNRRNILLRVIVQKMGILLLTIRYRVLIQVYLQIIGRLNHVLDDKSIISYWICRRWEDSIDQMQFLINFLWMSNLIKVVFSW